MEVMFLGEAIKRRRLELGLTQEQLCEGICEPITISRLENGKQTPSRNRINAILERLDMPADRYYALLSKRELDIEALLNQSSALNIQFSHAPKEERNNIREKALQLHHDLEHLADSDDKLIRQHILRSKIVFGKEDGPYTPSEQRDILMEALKITSPNFDLDTIGSGLYTLEEIKIINQLAVTHINEKEHMEAISILRQLYRYICKRFHNIPANKAHLNMVGYNYARELLVVGQYQQAIKIAEEGQRICVEHGHYLSMYGLLEVMAEAYFFLGDTEKSKDLYYQAYYICKAIGDHHNLQFIRAEAKEHLSLIFET